MLDAMTTVINGIAGLKERVGTHLGYSDYMEITQERVNTFAEATGDHQWIHVDPERAREEMHKGQFRPGRTRRRHSIAGTWWQGIRIRRTVSGDTQRRRRRPRFMRRHRRPDRQPDTQHGRRLREEEEDQELPEQPAERQLGHGKRLTLIDEQLVAAAKHGLDARAAIWQWRQLAADAAQVDVDAAVVAFVRSPQSLL